MSEQLLKPTQALRVLRGVGRAGRRGTYFSKLHKDLRMSPTTVNEAIKRLELAGWIVRKKGVAHRSPSIPVKICYVTRKGQDVLRKTRI